MGGDFRAVRLSLQEFFDLAKANQKLTGWIDSLSKSAYIEFK